MSSAQSLDQIKAAMSQINDLFNTEVFEKRNFAALDDIYTTDARILPPGAPMISGRDSIKSFWSQMIVSANAESASLESVDVIPTGDGIVEIGRAVLTLGAGDQMEAKYVVYWRSEESRWKWHIDIWNPNS